MADRDELIEQLAEFLWTRLKTHGPIFVGGPATKRLAEALVDSDGDLGGGRRIAIIEEAGNGVCPRHGNALCPEQYMLDGGMVPWPSYRETWDESMRCGQRQPTFRIVTPNPEEA